MPGCRDCNVDLGPFRRDGAQCWRCEHAPRAGWLLEITLEAEARRRAVEVGRAQALHAAGCEGAGLAAKAGFRAAG